MKITFPHTIENIHGEKLTFQGISRDTEGEFLVVENELRPNAGPPMHVHHFQDEALTVRSGKMGYKLEGGEDMFAEVGDTVHFKAGVAHRFWNTGKEVLKCEGFIRPPDNIVYFLGEVYKSINENGGKPGFFEGAYLSERYKSEFEITEIPVFVRKALFPVVVSIGKLLGKYEKYKDAPAPRQ